LIGAVALLVLFRYRIGVIPVIAGSGTAGLVFMFIKPLLAGSGVVS
jgi:chromate transporter